MRAFLLNQITIIDAQILLAQTAFTASLEANEIEEYRFDSAEASQRAKMRDPDKLFSQIESLYKRRAAIVSRLNGTGIVNMNLRRKG
jgi:hypothetical protein